MVIATWPVVAATTPLINEPARPIPQNILLDREKVQLGKRVFHDPRLSRDNTISCATCHDLTMGGVDGLRRSVGIDGQEGIMNSPTVFNSSFNFRQFWDGRAATLEEQAAAPIHNPLEMGSNWPQVLVKLKNDPDYVAKFKKIYDDGIQPANILDAIAEFERSLYTPNSRFDQFLRGNKQAMTDFEKSGYELFKQLGCASCHQGVALGANMYQKFGLFGDFYDDFLQDHGNVKPDDLGRFNVTGLERDKFYFKVPSLRNVALTAPYFHDGFVDDLEMAVLLMGKYQLGRTLSKSEVDRLTAFLNTLTGEYAGEPL
ncbi:MAG: cytochrome-c peroxidase [Magnetococcales bacterium]|nr:cytochrome-c peroxidase [Magnetococcales bacterium]